jgi:hypothetical protein
MPIALYPAGALLGTGDAGEAVIGTGDSRIRGVDAVWEYNGLIMNYRGWYDTYLITDIDGIDDADIRDKREDRPGEHGEIPYDAFYGGRSIIITGKIRAFSLEKMVDMKQALEEAFNELVESPLVVHNANPRNDLFVMARKNQKLVIRETQNNFDFTRDFIISLRASREYFQSRIENYAGFTDAQIVANTQLSIAQKGNWQAQPRFVVTGYFPTGFVINLVHPKKGSSQLKLTWPSGTFSASSDFVVDCLNKTITGGPAASNMMQYLDDQSDFLKLHPGATQVSITPNSTRTATAQAAVYWTDNYK